MKKGFNVSRIQVPNKIIGDREFSNDAFVLYVVLKRMSYNNVVSTRLSTLKNKLEWKDNRTFKKNFDILFNSGLIDKKIERLTVYVDIDLKISPIEDGEGFTQVDVSTLDRIKEVTESIEVKGLKNKINAMSTGLRLFYYYEKNYNVQVGKAYPTYAQISKDTKISSNYISALNDVFHENGIVKVTEGGYWIEVNKQNVKEIRRECNGYIPMCNRYEY